GDGSGGFRAIARRFLGDPELHMKARHQILRHLANNRHNNDFHIHDGIDKEHLYSIHSQPTTYSSYIDYLLKMPMPSTYMGQPEITAAISMYECSISVHFHSSTLPHPNL
ncbi:unnamed protein product, partial [Sphacelaria rigidula]